MARRRDREVEPHRGWGLVTVAVLSLYGIAQNSARNGFYTQKLSLEKALNTTDPELSTVLGAGCVSLSLSAYDRV